MENKNTWSLKLWKDFHHWYNIDEFIKNKNKILNKKLEEAVFDFNIEFDINTTDHYGLKVLYRRLKQDTFKLQNDYNTLKNNWIVKVLIKLNIIKL